MKEKSTMDLRRENWKGVKGHSASRVLRGQQPNIRGIKKEVCFSSTEERTYFMWIMCRGTRRGQATCDVQKSMEKTV